MRSIIAAQGPASSEAGLGDLRFEVRAPRTGVVASIDNRQMARIARLAGAPLDRGAGVDLCRRVRDPVKKGDVLYRVYAAFPSDFAFAKALVEKDTGFRIRSG